MKHKGSFEDLKTMVRAVGREIAQSGTSGNAQQIRTTDGAIVNWFESTGTVQFQGAGEAKKSLQADLLKYTGGAPMVATDVGVNRVPAPASAPAASKVFIVHGHDSVAREQLELVIHKLGLDPYVLQNTGGGGLTIIEALEAEIGDRAGAAKFGIVLLTPDDVGYAKSAGEKEAQPRARQNVVLEMGMLISALGRKNVAILKKQHLDLAYSPRRQHCLGRASGRAERACDGHDGRVWAWAPYPSMTLGGRNSEFPARGIDQAGTGRVRSAGEPRAG